MREEFTSFFPSLDELKRSKEAQEREHREREYRKVMARLPEPPRAPEEPPAEPPRDRMLRETYERANIDRRFDIPFPEDYFHPVNQIQGMPAFTTL